MLGGGGRNERVDGGVRPTTCSAEEKPGPLRHPTISRDDGQLRHGSIDRVSPSSGSPDLGQYRR